MYKHILFPTDGSEASFKAFPHALSLARTYEGRITVANIHKEFLDHEERQFLRVSNEQFQEMMKQKANKARDTIETHLKAHDVNVPYDIVIREGSPGKRICELCDEFDVDLVVMATHGRTGLSELLHGSVAEYVLEHAGVPVLAQLMK